MDRISRSERIRAALHRCAGNAQSLVELVVQFREQDRAGVRRAVELAELGAFSVLSEGERCAAALVVPLYAGQCGSVESAARRCGLEWLRAVRDEFPDAEGLDLLPVLEREEEEGHSVTGLDDRIDGHNSVGTVPAICSTERRELLQLVAATYFRENRTFDRVVLWQGLPVGATNRTEVAAWRPGCVAVDRRGRLYVAVCRGFENSATKWEPVP